jgi:phage I-like protein
MMEDDNDLQYLLKSLGEGVPREIQVFPYGMVDCIGGDSFMVNDDVMTRVIEKFSARGTDMVVDYEHQTEGGAFASPSGVAPAAGWIKKLINRKEEGLWAVVEWTQRAKEFIAAREYRYHSPEIWKLKKIRIW